MESLQAPALSRRFRVWVICVDYEHGSDRNLLDPAVQSLVMELIKTGCVMGVGAALGCCSFSRAVNPAVRSSLHPEGLSGLTPNMFEKVRVGNLHAGFVLKVLMLSRSMGLAFWAENPDGSYMWLLRSYFGGGDGVFRFDMRRPHTAWRKRTRVIANTLPAGRRELCRGGSQPYPSERSRQVG